MVRLFFIPIFPVGTKYVSVCSMCAGAMAVNKEYAEHLGQAAVEQRGQPVRITPDGPITPYGPAPSTPIPANWSGEKAPSMPPIQPPQAL